MAFFEMHPKPASSKSILGKRKGRPDADKQTNVTSARNKSTSARITSWFNKSRAAVAECGVVITVN